MLIVVNVDDSPLDLRVHLPLRMRVTDVRPIFGQRTTFSSARGRIHDRLGPREVVVYEANCVTP